MGCQRKWSISFRFKIPSIEWCHSAGMGKVCTRCVEFSQPIFRNENAILAIKREMEMNPMLKVTLPSEANKDVLKSAISNHNG